MANGRNETRFSIVIEDKTVIITPSKMYKPPLAQSTTAEHGSSTAASALLIGCVSYVQWIFVAGIDGNYDGHASPAGCRYCAK